MRQDNKNKARFFALGVVFIAWISIISEGGGQTDVETIVNQVPIDPAGKRTLLKYYSTYQQGDYVIKEFEEPYLLDIKKSTDQSGTLKVPENYLYQLYAYQRSTKSERSRVMTKPSSYLKIFVNDLFQLTEEGGIEEQENKLWEDQLGKIFFDQRYLDVTSALALINKYIEYVSDYSTDVDASGNIEPGRNRDKFKIYYDNSEYWKFPEQTLIDGYGDCEDFSILAVAMTIALWQRHQWSNQHSYYVPRIGICSLSDPNKSKGHAIIAIEADISFLKTFLDHQFSFTESDFSLYPHIYCQKTIKLPKFYKKECEACPWKNNDRFIILLEPQDYHVKAGEIDIVGYSKKKVFFDDTKISLHDDYQRVRDAELNQNDISNPLLKKYILYKIEKYP